MAPRKPIKPTVKAEVKPEIKVEAKKPKTPRNPILPRFFAKIKIFVHDERTQLITGLCVLIFVLYLLVSFISYFFTGAADQSKIEMPWDDLLETRGDIQNWGALWGAFFSETLINKWFGLASFSMLYFGTIVGLRLIRIKTIAVWKAFFITSFWLLWGSITISYMLYPVYKEFLFFSPGGKHGDFANQWLRSYVGIPGTLMILIIASLAFAIVTAKSTLPFLKGLFTRKPKEVKQEFRQEFGQNFSSQPRYAPRPTEPSVAVGTEIIPEDWVTKARNDFETNNEFVVETGANEFEMSIDQDEPETQSIEAEEMAIEFDLDTDLSPESEIEEDESGVKFEVETATSEELVPGAMEMPIVAPLATAVASTVPDNLDPHYNLASLGKYDPTLDLSHYVHPTMELLKAYASDNDNHIDMVEQNANKNRIITTLQNYGIDIDSIKATVGPTITLYEIVPKAGIRISKIRNLEYDIMLSLAATGIRIIAPIPGKGTIGIEVPNSDPQVVSMHSVIASKKFQESKFELPVAFGRTITNDIFMVDLTKMPHLLVAGATGQGKSVGLNAIITSLLYKKHPAELKFVLVDPKKVEFNIYSDIEKHFLAKLPDGEDAIITDVSKVVETLNSLCKEMDDRYDLLKRAHVRNIREYNDKFFNRNLNPEKGHRFLPYIVVIVDEFGDLIMTAGKEVELPIARIAQLARAVGIHMILATQRPSVNIITGVIKANFPARVAFRVSSMMDSRTILDAPGANQLVGRGDMLFSQGSDLIRVQCAFVDTPEVENIVHHIGRQQGYPTAFYLPEYTAAEGEGIDAASVDMSKRDPLFEEAARLIVANQQGSTSLIQRKFSIGYNRAGRIVDQLEVAGVVGPFEGSKARQVLVMDDYHLEQILKNL